MVLFDFLFGKRQNKPTGASSSQQDRFDWRLSEAHLQLLSRFLLAQRVENVAQPYLEDALGEKPDAAIKRFMAEGMLVPASLQNRLLATYGTAELKALLRERGLKVSGTKDSLIERLTSADPQGMAAKVAKLNIYECSPEARTMAEQYTGNQWADKNAAFAESIAFLRAHEFQQASLVVSSYESRQVFKRGVGVDWSNPDTLGDVRDLRTIFSARPGILAGLPEDAWESLRVAAGMMLLWGKNRATEWLPANFVGIERFDDDDTAARMLVFYARSQRDLEAYRQAGVTKVRVLGCDDSCSACRRLMSGTYALANVPELPHPGCTHEIGCRCTLVAET